MAPVALFIFTLLTHLLVLHSAEEEGGTSRCRVSYCSDTVGNISFPFRSKMQHPECGFFPVDCSNTSRPTVQLEERGYWHEFEGPLQLEERGYWHELEGPRTYTIRINDRQLHGLLTKEKCSDEFFDNLRLPSPPSPIYDVPLYTHNLTLFKCSNSALDNISKENFHHGCKNAYYTYYFTSSDDSLPNSTPSCSITQIPMLPDHPYDLSALTTEFTVQLKIPAACYKCHQTPDECLDHEGRLKCPTATKAKDNERRLKIGLGLGIGGLGIGLPVLLVIACCLGRKLSSCRFIFFWKKQNLNHQVVEAFLKSNGPLQVRRYTYLEVKKMTHSFKQKLGQGGYGSVYKGKLKDDGCVVAVKVLNKLKGNGEDFMNEVAAISRTSHVNIVPLLGFCFEGSKKALIYEFMPNGSLEKFIYAVNARDNEDNNHLGWEALDQISLGIARGLEYLHRGCNTRILHFDIKPHNILLDKNFTPKISDFGLAKICNITESIVSMTGARGTVGYIAPEVFCRNFGGVSHKSDVYSYGMMLSEMVGGRRNINAEVENTSEIYFPHWIYKRLELDKELGLESIMNEEDKVRARKMIIVSLWCIQTDPSNRPAMKDVIKMLEGSVDALQIPPKPYLSSPPRSPAAYSTTTTLVSTE